MQRLLALLAVVLSHLTLSHALVTLQTIRDITNVTEECRGRITVKGVDGSMGEGMQVVMGMGGMGQSVLSAGHDGGGEEDGDDVEDVSPIPRSVIFWSFERISARALWQKKWD